MTIIPSLDWTTNYIWGIDDDALCEVDVRGKCRGVLSRPAELWMDLLVSNIDRTGVNNILDLGCGTGRFSHIEAVEGDGPSGLVCGDRTVFSGWPGDGPPRLRHADCLHCRGSRFWSKRMRSRREPRKSPFATKLWQQVRNLGLHVDHIAPIRGRVVPLGELAQEVRELEARAGEV